MVHSRLLYAERSFMFLRSLRTPPLSPASPSRCIHTSAAASIRTSVTYLRTRRSRMTSRAVSRPILLGALLMILAMPVMGYGQEATVTGTIADSTGGVLPGVTIKAVNEASGNSFEAVTDTRG